MSMLEKLRPWLRERIGLFPLPEQAPDTLVDTDVGTGHPVTVATADDQQEPAAATNRIRRNWLYRSGPWQMK